VAQHEARIEDVAHEALRQPADALRATRMEDHQVDVRVGRHVAAAEAAMGHQRHLPAQAVRTVFTQVGKRDRRQVQHDRVKQIGQGPRNLHARRAARMALADFLASRR
jgi:hypothetical protein